MKTTLATLLFASLTTCVSVPVYAGNDNPCRVPVYNGKGEVSYYNYDYTSQDCDGVAFESSRGGNSPRGTSASNTGNGTTNLTWQGNPPIDRLFIRLKASL